MLGHKLDISCGLLTVTLQHSSGRKNYIKVFISQRSDTVFCETVNEEGLPAEVFYRMTLEPHAPEDGLPAYTVLDLEIAKRSWRYHYNEGGNDVVFYHLAGARLGILDPEKFKRQVRYSLMPNETAADRVTLTGGRYADNIPFDFMCRMGIWFENFSLYAVINECLIWGHTDTVHLFPNWDMNKEAAFCSMRTKGAFLVSASCGNGTVGSVTVFSECGGEFRLKNPWSRAVDQENRIYDDERICIQMKKGEEIVLTSSAIENKQPNSSHR